MSKTRKSGNQLGGRCILAFLAFTGFDHKDFSFAADPCQAPPGLDCNHNGILDSCDLDIGISSDCNNNGIPDECDIADGTSGDCDHNGIPDECWPDCNGNGVPDVCDIVNGDAIDCDGDKVPDDCEIAQHPEKDCNQNGVPDLCDILQGLIVDCNHNGISDECEVRDHHTPDCNSNGIPDECDIRSGTSTDCDRNWIPDECDLPDHRLADCNHNGVADVCEIANGASDCDSDGILDECEMYSGTDCNHNGVYDPCDILQGTSEDCNQNHIPDECDVQLTGHDCDRNGIVDSCELAAGTAQDCDHDHRIDLCEIAGGLAVDCDRDGVPDSCQYASGDFADCDGNGVIDLCDILAGKIEDCNQNGIPDTCDLASGTSVDANGNSTPDECEGLRLYVCAAAAPGGDGSSWFHALQDLQAALDAVALWDVSKREIWVSQGTYYPSKHTDLNDPRSATFTLLDGLSLKGRYAGPGAPDPNVRSGSTVLSGDLAKDDTPDQGNRTDNAEHVLTAVGPSNHVSLDGISVTSGAAPTKGGGLFAMNASVDIYECNFSTNTASPPQTNGSSGGDVTAHTCGPGGGAIYAGNTSLVLTNDSFVGNRATGGGAILMEGSSTLSADDCWFDHNQGTCGGALENLGASAVLNDCEFDNNFAGTYGGALAGGGYVIKGTYFYENDSEVGGAVNVESGLPVSFENCTFEGNTGSSGGGIYLYAPSSSTISGCTFLGNSANTGGGLYATSAFSGKALSFSSNQADQSGGGLYARGGQGVIDLESCSFRSNRAASGAGAAIDGPFVGKSLNFYSNKATAFGGGLSIDGNSSIRESQFTGNSAMSGGGLYSDYANVQLINDKFHQNNASNGGAVSLYLAGPSSGAPSGEINHCEFSSNQGTTGAALYFEAGTASLNDTAFVENLGEFGGAIAQVDGQLALANCTIAGNSAAGLGGGIITGGEMSLKNTIVWGNVVWISHQGDLQGLADELSQVEGIHFVDFSHSCVQGWTGIYGDDTNFGYDPIFVNPHLPDTHPPSGDEDYHLTPGSPCINAGANPDSNCGQANRPACLPIGDLDGHPRILCGTVDIGAYEFGKVGDYDCDQSVNLDDFANWPTCFTGPATIELSSLVSEELASSPTKGLRATKAGTRSRGVAKAPECVAFDFDADGDIDLADFAAFERIQIAAETNP